MTLPTTLARVGWTGPELARRLGVRDDTVRNWLTGKRDAPVAVVEWIERQAGRLEVEPVPVGWDS